MTVVSTVPWWWALWLRFNWARGRVTRILRRLLRLRGRKGRRFLALASINFAHWSLLSRVPPGGPRRARRRLSRRYSCLIFQSNFNGTRDLYLEVFSVAVLWQMRMLWWGANGVPDMLPISRFQEYARHHDIEPAHYYCAYPEGTVKTIGAALEARERFEDFAHKARELDDATTFAAEYDKFLRRVELLL